MRDVVKTSYGTSVVKGTKRKRKRKRNLILYYLLILILVAVVMVSLSLTVLFNVSDVAVSGTSAYDDKTIIEYSGLKVGDNLFRSDIKKAEKTIAQHFIYIDTVNVKRVIPDRIVIEITPCEESAVLKVSDKYYKMTSSGKILGETESPDSSLMMIEGFNPKDIMSGKIAESEDDGKNEQLRLLLEKIDTTDFENVTQIDITDTYNMKIMYDNRITVELGGKKDLEYKLIYAKELITNKISKVSKGTLFMSNEKSNEASFVLQSDLKKYKENQMTTALEETGESVTQEGEVTSADKAETTIGISSEIAATN